MRVDLDMLASTGRHIQVYLNERIKGNSSFVLLRIKKMADLEGGSNKKLDDDYQKFTSRNVVKILVLFSAVALLILVLYHSSSYPLQFFPNSSYKPVLYLLSGKTTPSSNGSIAGNLLDIVNVSAQETQL